MKYKIGDYVKIINPALGRNEMWTGRVVRIKSIAETGIYPYYTERIGADLPYNITNNYSDFEIRLASEDEVMAEMI